MDSSGIPRDGPEVVLGQVARRLRLRYSRTYVARAVASHAQPTSLLALVEVAADLGIKTTAGRIEASELNDVGYPTIVHFGGTEKGGFGLLEGVTDEGFKVWDSLNGLHVIRRDAFLAQWSGIVTLVERSDARGAAESGYLRNRLTELVFSGYDPPALIDNRAATLLRVLFGAVVAALLVLAVVARPAPDRLAAGAVALLSLVGLAVTVITGVSIGAQEGSLSDRICARGKLVDCHSVLSSRYSRVFGIPLSDVGIAFFGSVVLLLATGAAGAGGDVWPVVSWLFVASVPFSFVLVGVQVAMRQLCTLCLAVHTVNLSAAIIGWVWLRPARWSVGDIVSGLLLVGLYFLLMLFLAIPYFRKHQGMRVLAGRQRRISGSPFASLAEVLTEPPTALAAGDCAVGLGGDGAPHELVVFVHPSCGKCDPVIQQVRALAHSGMVTAHIGLAPKDAEEADRNACSAIVAVGLALGPERLIEGYAAAKKRLGALKTGDPVEVMAAELSTPRAPIDDTLGEARRRTLRAEEFVDEHAEGTPAVFFDTRLYRGEMGHLAFLLERHPDLLAPTRLARDGSRTEVEASS
jgi:uncharacterized membrane protein